MDKGFYVIFEGGDGAGKTTVMHRVADALEKRIQDELGETSRIVRTHHPGSTPLGKHLRQLVKYPKTISEDIEIDELSRQMLYMVDTISFVRTLLEPSLADNKIVFADRSSYISAMVYGIAEGLGLKDIEKLFDTLTPPKADRLVVLQLPASVSRERLAETRQDGDHFDNKPSEFFEKIAKLYDDLITTSPEQTALASRSVPIDDVAYVDATLPLHQVVDIITSNLFNTLVKRCVTTDPK